MTRRRTRRDLLRTGVGLTAVGLGGCLDAPRRSALLSDGFERGLKGWTTHAHIGPEEPLSAFDRRIERSREHAATGEWSLELFTEGDHDDGTAWATTELDPGDASSFDVSVRAWSPSESFNTLRNLVVYLGPEEPTTEADFPDPGANSTAVPDAPFGGLREPLHLAEGWREYTFGWDPETPSESLFFAVGVSVVWEADATHYVDDVVVTGE